MKRGFFKEAIGWICVIGAIFAFELFMASRDKAFHPAGGYTPIFVALAFLSIIGGTVFAAIRWLLRMRRSNRQNSN